MADDKKRDDYTIEMGERKDGFRTPSPVMRSPPRPTSVTENALIAILSYCGSSIMMTVTNKYVLSGLDFNLNFFLLCVQVRCSSARYVASLTTHSP